MRMSILACLFSAVALSRGSLHAQGTTRIVVDTTTKYQSDSLPLKPTRTISFDTDGRRAYAVKRGVTLVSTPSLRSG
jgi:hypothetical protein